MNQPPPVLAAPPQFTAAYWQKAPRQTLKAHIERVTNLEEGWVEIVMKEGMRVRRQRSEIQQLLAPNAEVHIETFNKELVTGLFVPGVGWAFRMTAQDLADYARDLSMEMHRQQQATKELMVTHVAVALDAGLEAMNVLSDDTDRRAEVALALAKISIHSLQTGPA